MIEIKECVYFNSVLGVCDIDGSVNCPCENYEELVRMSEITKEKGDMMTEKRFSVKKSGSGLFYRDGDYEIDSTIQFIIETVEMKLNQLSDENEELKKENEFLKKRCDEYLEEAGLNSDYFE